jgi:hypothetical protein
MTETAPDPTPFDKKNVKQQPLILVQPAGEKHMQLLESTYKSASSPRGYCNVPQH